MKNHVFASLLFVSCLLHADFDDSTIFDKSMRIGRFSYEDSFDESLVQTILNNSSGAIKKNITKLLYPSKDEYEIKRLLLLGGTSNVVITAIAKSIALRCGYEYYVIEAASLLQEYRSGNQILLNEIRPILQQGKPIAFIITELPELVNYSGILASTLWMLLDQCEVYSDDVCVIATSMFHKGQLSQQVKDRFGENIVTISFDKYLQDKIEEQVVPVKKTSWMPKGKTVFFGSLLTMCTLVQVVSVLVQMHKAILIEEFLVSHEEMVKSLKKQESQWQVIKKSLQTMLNKKWITVSDYLP